MPRPLDGLARVWYALPNSSEKDALLKIGHSKSGRIIHAKKSQKGVDYANAFRQIVCRKVLA
jgi:hypothetical protein